VYRRSQPRGRLWTWGRVHGWRSCKYTWASTQVWSPNQQHQAWANPLPDLVRLYSQTRSL
jgi:hypothetical protein